MCATKRAGSFSSAAPACSARRRWRCSRPTCFSPTTKNPPPPVTRQKMLRALGPHFPPKAKRVIYLHMVGGPSQMDLFDYKPKLGDYFDKDLPDSVRMGQRITTMTSGQKRLPIAPSKYKFAQYGKSGMWLSELLPWTAKMVDDLCFIRSMNTDAINHEPAITFMQTGNQITGKPCLGSWVSYGLGSMNENLPTFVVLIAKSTNTEQLQAIGARLWSAGYLPGEHAGVSLRTAGDPILFINNPARRGRKSAAHDARRFEGAERNQFPHRRRSRNAHAHQAIRAGVPHAIERAGTVRSLARTRRDLRALRRRGEEARHVCEHGAARAAARRARRALRADLPQQLGHALKRQRPAADAMQGRGPGVLRFDSGFESARHARRHARRLGRRIWPHDLFAGRV